MSAIEKIKEVIAEAIMKRNGWDEESKTSNPIEWDITREDSQYRMVAEETDYIVDAFLRELAEVEVDDEEDSTEHEHGHDHEHKNESIFDEYGHIRRSQTNTTTATIFIFMDAGTGKPRYVSDVREWLAKVDRLGVPDDAEIEGTLYLSVEINEPYTERIECGGCGTKDILLTVHSCEETPC
jgi:hypothetical protein